MPTGRGRGAHGSQTQLTAGGLAANHCAVMWMHVSVHGLTIVWLINRNNR